ncbi:MAG: reverse gyrase [Nanopusillaceae archaeon]
MNYLKNFNELNLDLLKKEIEENRKEVKDILEGKISKKKEDLLKTILFIVESPNKAKTISNFFGKPSIRIISGISFYEVSIGNKQILIASTKGHILDLTIENVGFFGILVGEKIIPIYNTIKKCLICGRQFTEYIGDEEKCPYCGGKEIDDSINRIKALQEVAQEVDEILIGTDPDYEGEAIAYFVYLLLKPFNKNIKRVEFHEVTKNAILSAIENPREINLNMVKAQIVRRVEDRWLGFSLSKIVQENFNKKWLSAGRVQTPVLGWIIDRYFEKLNSKCFMLILTLEDEKQLSILTDIKNRQEIKKIKNNLINKELLIKSYIEKEEELHPLPPLMTSTMLNLASKILKIEVDRIMQIAQDLFELGLITYHRTDSIRVSNTGIQIAKDYISEKFGLEFFNGRSWSESGAHEAIRPTKPIDKDKLKEMIENGEIELFMELSQYHYALYDIIFKRFIQSQMNSVIVKKFEQIIHIPEIEKDVKIEGILDVLKHGWDLVDSYVLNTNKNKPLEKTKVVKVKYKVAYKYPLYTQSDVIDMMREKNIGRPSTYATIISKLLDRKYIINRNNYLIPLDLGIKVYNFLKENFQEHVSEEKTRILENKMKILEEGKEDYYKLLSDLYRETLEILEIWKSKNKE